MIRKADNGYRITEDNFVRCVAVIDKSGAADYIEEIYQLHRKPGGRYPSGPEYTFRGTLTVWLAILRIGKPASLAEVVRVMSTLTSGQLARVGMHAHDDMDNYGRLHSYLARRLVHFDPGSDLQARRQTNGEHRIQLATRSPETLAKLAEAKRRLHHVVNLIVAASIDEPAPLGYQGDVVADETLVDVAGSDKGLGMRDDKNRAAAYGAKYYARDRKNKVATGGVIRDIQKQGVAKGVTALVMVGSGTKLYSIPKLVSAITIAGPTSGSAEALATCIASHKDNGFDPQTGPRHQPMLTIDMGYNVKRGFNDLMLNSGYAPVARYPEHWTTAYASDSAFHSRNGVSDGPIHYNGDFYCPAVQSLIGDRKLVRPTVDLLAADDGFETQDRVLQHLFPLLMGTNSRPYRGNSSPGRPAKKSATDGTEQTVKIDLVCPAVQGRVRCPLKPESTLIANEDAPDINPTWPADRFRCCAQSQITVPFSQDQWRMAQWAKVPGSWEHATYFEAARSATEQTFSMLKSMSVSGMQDLKWGARRDPMIDLMIALWVAAVNMSVQDSFRARKKVPDSIRKRMKQIEDDLGRKPTRVPPRT